MDGQPASQPARDDNGERLVVDLWKIAVSRLLTYEESREKHEAVIDFLIELDEPFDLFEVARGASAELRHVMSDELGVEFPPGILTEIMNAEGITVLGRARDLGMMPSASGDDLLCFASYSPTLDASQTFVIEMSYIPGPDASYQEFERDLLSQSMRVSLNPGAVAAKADTVGSATLGDGRQPSEDEVITVISTYYLLLRMIADAQPGFVRLAPVET